MISNDILRSVRYILKANNNDLVRILALDNVEATAEQIAVWLRKEDEEGFQRCPDIVLSSFLNGLIYEKRGKDESAPALEPMVLRGEYFSDQALDVGMAEISLIPESELIGKSVREIGFRTRYGLNVVGLKRNGVALEGSLADEPLLLGDIILVVGNWKLIGMLAKQGRDFVALNLPEEVSEASPAHSQAPHAIFCLVLMVALMLTNEIPNPVAAIIACLLMGKFRCIDAESAYKSIHWPSIILIVGMMPFAVALQKTGGVALAVKGLMDIGGGYGPHMMLGCLFVLSAVIGLFISNTATAVLMAPIALAAAKTMGVSP